MVDPITGNERWAVHARGLRKRYGKVVALAGVDLAVPEGSVVLLAGPNGAGKTTLLKLLLDLLPPDGGEVEVLGRNPSHRGHEVRAGTGFLPEEVAFPFGRMSVQEMIGFHARFRPGWDPEYAQYLANQLELRMDRPWKKLSKGEARRAQLLTALAHRPALLLLDEPTDGLDPLVRERVLALLAEHLVETGATTLYCTHVLHEAQSLADRLLILRAGSVQVDEGIEELRQTHRRVRIRSRAPDTPAPPAPAFVVREEGRSGEEVRWVVRASEADVRGWAEEHACDVAHVEGVSVADTALAYLTDGGDR